MFSQNNLSCTKVLGFIRPCLVGATTSLYWRCALHACPKMNVPQDKKQVISNQMVPRKPEKHRPSLDWRLTSKHEDGSHLQEKNVEGILNVVDIDMVLLFSPSFVFLIAKQISCKIVKVMMMV
jgi:hypothetical protein